MNKILRSVWAVVAGFATVAILSVITDAILEKVGVFPMQSNPELYTTWMLALALAYRSLYTVIGGYLTAALAPSNPRHHVIALMILGGIGGILGAIAGWNMGAHWYPVALALTGPVFVWIGGKIKINKINKQNG